MGKRRVLWFIRLIREADSDSVRRYTEGLCYQFYLILKVAFPEAVPYYEVDHVITRIGRHYYDVTGKVKRGGKVRIDTNARRLRRLRRTARRQIKEQHAHH